MASAVHVECRPAVATAVTWLRHAATRSRTPRSTRRRNQADRVISSLRAVALACWAKVGGIRNAIVASDMAQSIPLKSTPTKTAGANHYEQKGNTDEGTNATTRRGYGYGNPHRMDGTRWLDGWGGVWDARRRLFPKYCSGQQFAAAEMQRPCAPHAEDRGLPLSKSGHPRHRRQTVKLRTALHQTSLPAVK
jgi:hypothetical protein